MSVEGLGVGEAYLPSKGIRLRLPSLQIGLLTTMAILLHEIPHEVSVQRVAPRPKIPRFPWSAWVWNLARALGWALPTEVGWGKTQQGTGPEAG